MLSIGKRLRLSRLTEKDGRTLVVAMDHSIVGITEGIENVLDVVEKVIEGGADAVLVNLGVARKIIEKFGGNIAIVLTIPFDPKYVELATKMGVDAVKTTYFGSVPLSEEKYNKFSAIGQACEEWEIPWMAEVVPVDSQGKTIFEIETIKKAARIGSELGGDIVKTAYAGTPKDYRKVVETSLAPIVVMGGPKMENIKDVLQMTKDSIDAGAIGGAIGRNIWQHKDPTKMTRVIASIIHENATVEEALEILSKS
jgi:fructose-bisphosphate aldolase/2-amino-3,7-dideoxy-D-threo-hept-6-ulosonate synthase